MLLRDQWIERRIAIIGNQSSMMLVPNSFDVEYAINITVYDWMMKEKSHHWQPDEKGMSRCGPYS